MTEFLSKQRVAELLDMHPESIMRLVREGQFPKPIKTGPGDQYRCRFIKAEVERWVAERMEARAA